MKHFFYDLVGYNAIIFNKLNHMLGQEESYLLTFADQVGFYRSFPLCLSLVLIYCYFSIASVKESKTDYEKAVLEWSITLITLFISLLFMACIVSFFKFMFAFKRPFCHEDIAKIKVFHSALSGADCHKSFPSGHTAYISTILFSIWPVLNPVSKGVGIMLALAVGISRIASGVHFPSDVLWAGLISLLSVLLIHKIIKRVIKEKYFRHILKLANQFI